MSFSFNSKNDQDYINEYLDDLDTDNEFFDQSSEDDQYSTELEHNVFDNDYVSEEDYE
jgi:hypothetical protein